MHPIVLAVRLFLKQDRCRRSASDWPGDAPWVLGLTPLERVPCRPQTRPSVIRTVPWASFKYPLPHLLALEDSTAVQVADRGGGCWDMAGPPSWTRWAPGPFPPALATGTTRVSVSFLPLLWAPDPGSGSLCFLPESPLQARLQKKSSAARCFP